MYVIMKDGKFVKDFTDGKKFTTSFSLAEKYTEHKPACIAAQQYGKSSGSGFKVVKV